MLFMIIISTFPISSSVAYDNQIRPTSHTIMSLIPCAMIMKLQAIDDVPIKKVSESYAPSLTGTRRPKIRGIHRPRLSFLNLYTLVTLKMYNRS